MGNRWFTTVVLLFVTISIGSAQVRLRGGKAADEPLDQSGDGGSGGPADPGDYNPDYGSANAPAPDSGNSTGAPAPEGETQAPAEGGSGDEGASETDAPPEAPPDSGSNTTVAQTEASPPPEAAGGDNSTAPQTAAPPEAAATTVPPPPDQTVPAEVPGSSEAPTSPNAENATSSGEFSPPVNSVTEEPSIGLGEPPADNGTLATEAPTVASGENQTEPAPAPEQTTQAPVEASSSGQPATEAPVEGQNQTALAVEGTAATEVPVPSENQTEPAATEPPPPPPSGNQTSESGLVEATTLAASPGSEPPPQPTEPPPEGGSETTPAPTETQPPENGTVSVPTETQPPENVPPENGTTTGAPAASEPPVTGSSPGSRPESNATNPEEPPPTAAPLPEFTDSPSPFTVAPNSAFVKSNGINKACKINADCYDMREPNDWCPLVSGTDFGERGCFCDHAQNRCFIERVNNGVHEHSDCGDRASTSCKNPQKKPSA